MDRVVETVIQGRPTNSEVGMKSHFVGYTDEVRAEPSQSCFVACLTWSSSIVHSSSSPCCLCCFLCGRVCIQLVGVEELALQYYAQQDQVRLACFVAPSCALLACCDV